MLLLLQQQKEAINEAIDLCEVYLSNASSRSS